MSIKTSISLFILMMGFSFNASSSANATTYYKFYELGLNGSDCGVTVGSVVSSGFCNGKSYSYTNPGGYVWTYTFKGSMYRSSSGYNYIYNSISVHHSTVGDQPDSTVSLGRAYTVTCSDNQVIDPGTFTCIDKPPNPICEPPLELNPDTLECYLPPFCERESINEELFAAEQSCAAEGGIFSYECSDFLESLETRCTRSDQCAIGFPNWPACLDDLDPSDDFAPPSGGFNPSNPPTANPDGPTFDKPEPDDVTPTDTTDEAVLKAVQNANRDSNEGFKALSTDLNKGFTDTNNALAKLNSTNTAIGDSVVEQMNQDYAIHQANKDLALQQTGAITAGASSVTDALGSQTGSLTDALGEQTGALTDAIGELADKLPEACDPALDERGCENPHGLGDNYIETTFGQMTKVTDDALDEGHSFVETKLQSVINNPLTNENESIMNNATSHLLDLLDYNQSCRALSFEANGRTYSIDCQVSSQIKLVLSFLIGMYTLMTLIEILLDGIVPLGAKPSATRYA